MQTRTGRGFNFYNKEQFLQLSRQKHRLKKRASPSVLLENTKIQTLKNLLSQKRL